VVVTAEIAAWLVLAWANNQKAVDLLNGKELDGRTITVTVARPREDKPRRDFGGNNHGGGNGGGNSFRQRSW
jgi:RNA recognition motif-containing protein